MRLAAVLLGVCASLPASDALFEASRKGDVAAVKAELDNGVPVDAKWRYEQTALFIAAGRGHTEVVRLLLQRGARADVRDSYYGMTAIGGAAEKGNAEIVTMLLDKGAPGADSVLLMASATGKSALVKALAVRPGISPKVLTQALSSAEAGRHAEAAEALRAAGAKPAPPLDPATLARFQGKYATVPQGREVLTVEPKGALLTVAGSTMSLDFRPLDETTFEPVMYPGAEQLEFTIDNGKVTGMVSRQGSRTIRYRRMEEAK